MEAEMTAAVSCIRTGCPSDTAVPDFLLDGAGVVIAMTYTCQVCGVSWIEDLRPAA